VALEAVLFEDRRRVWFSFVRTAQAANYEDRQHRAKAEKERKVAPVGPLNERSSTGSFHRVVGLFYAPGLSDVHAT
jgi:hypothetical protein